MRNIAKLMLLLIMINTILLSNEIGKPFVQTGNGKYPIGFEISKNEALLASISEVDVVLWDLNKEKEINNITISSIKSVKFIKNDSIMVFVNDKHIYYYDIYSSKITKTIKLETTSRNYISLSYIDNSYIYTLDVESMLCKYDLNSGKIIDKQIIEELSLFRSKGLYYDDLFDMNIKNDIVYISFKLIKAIVTFNLNNKSFEFLSNDFTKSHGNKLYLSKKYPFLLSRSTPDFASSHMKSLYKTYDTTTKELLSENIVDLHKVNIYLYEDKLFINENSLLYYKDISNGKQYNIKTPFIIDYENIGIAGFSNNNLIFITKDRKIVLYNLKNKQFKTLNFSSKRIFRSAKKDNIIITSEANKLQKINTNNFIIEKFNLKIDSRIKNIYISPKEDKLFIRGFRGKGTDNGELREQYIIKDLLTNKILFKKNLYKGNIRPRIKYTPDLKYLILTYIKRDLNTYFEILDVKNNNIIYKMKFNKLINKDFDVLFHYDYLITDKYLAIYIEAYNENQVTPENFNDSIHHFVSVLNIKTGKIVSTKKVSKNSDILDLFAYSDYININKNSITKFNNPMILDSKYNLKDYGATIIKNIKLPSLRVTNLSQNKLFSFSEIYNYNINNNFILSSNKNGKKLVLSNLNTYKEIWSKEIYLKNIVNIEFINNKFVSLIYSDGIIKLLDISNGNEVLSIIFFNNEEWIKITPEGFFDTSKNGVKYLNVRTSPMTVVSINNFYETFYRPDLIQKILNGKDIKNYIENTNLQSIIKRDSSAPEVRIINKSKTANKKDLNLELEVCTIDDGGYDNLTLYLNGMAVDVIDKNRALKLAKQNRTRKECFIIDKLITLQNGVNKIGFKATNKAGSIESNLDEIVVNYKGRSNSKPNLHIITIGIDKYRDGDLWLNYSKADAKEFTKSIKKVSKPLFRNIYTYKLFDKDVTKSKVLDIFKKVGSRTTREDVFMFYMAGHGITDEKTGAYFYLPVDFRYKNENSVREKGLSQNDFKLALSKIQAMKSLVILDTCNSGSFAEAMVSRGVLQKTAINKLTRATGRATIVASSKDQVALEGYKGHGVFTYTLLEALNGKGYGSDNKITIKELAGYIEDVLPDRTYNKWGYEQVPQSNINGNDFPIGVK